MGVQRALDFSSPALARHHLEKLERLGLAKKDAYGYFEVVFRSLGILKSFIVVGGSFVPRSIFVVVVFAVMTIGFLVNLPRNEHLLWALIPSVLGLVVGVFQTVQRYRLLSRRLYKK